MYPTTEEERRAFAQAMLPYFADYLRTHQTAIEQVELAVTREGIVSFPATQILGGVQKTVRVPLALITYEIDVTVNEVVEKGNYAKTQGDYAKTQGDYAKTQGDYANEKGAYANTQALAALAAKNEVTEWFPPFKQTAENFYNNTMTGTWQLWYNSFKSTAEGWYAPFRSNAEDWMAARIAEWAAFYTNGAVPDWAVLKPAVESATSLANEKAQLANSKAILANDAAEAAYDNADLANEKAGLANTKANLANEKAALANEKAALANLMAQYAQLIAENPPRVGKTLPDHTSDDNWWYYFVPNETLDGGSYVRSTAYAKGDNLDWDTMTQAEKEALAREMLAQIAFDDVPVEGSLKAVKSGGLYTEFAKKQDKITVASVATCESIIDELM